MQAESYCSTRHIRLFVSLIPAKCTQGEEYFYCCVVTLNLVENLISE